MTLRFTRLDRAGVRRLKPGEQIAEHGIVAQALADGDVRWSVNIAVDGARVHRVLGRESEKVTRSMCEEFIEAARTRAREGRLALPQGRKTWLGFRDAARQYLERLEQTGGRNIKRKRHHLDSYLLPFFTDQRLDTISAFTVDRYKARRTAAGAGAATVNRELATFSHLLNCAIEWRWLPARPCKVKLLKEGAGRIIALSDDQADALLKAAVADSDPYCWLFVAFGLNTAMRHSEILAARFEQLDFDKLRLFLPVAKAGQREQPITPELAAMLKGEREMAADRAGWIFPAARPNLAKAGHRTRMDRPFARAVKAAGLDPALVTPHTMRHTAITNLIKAGVDTPTVMKISGHKTVAMVLRYTHVHGTHIDKGIAILGRAAPARPVNGPPTQVTPELHQKQKEAV